MDKMKKITDKIYDLRLLKLSFKVISVTQPSTLEMGHGLVTWAPNDFHGDHEVILIFYLTIFYEWENIRML